jgi:hypothetical protein
LFVQAYAANGGRQTDAARAAGYADPAVDGYKLSRNARVIEAIYRETARRVATGGAVGVGVLVEIAQDKACPPAARVTAAKWLAESAGFGLAARRAGVADDPSDRPMESWTLAELDAFIGGGMRALEGHRGQEVRTIEGEARNEARNIDPDPTQG